jgi:hypothetical protein
LLNAPIKVQTFLANVPLFRELGSDELDRIALNTQQVREIRPLRSMWRGLET